MHKIVGISKSLPMYAQQAVLFSADHAAAYMDQHVLERNGMNAEAVGVLAAAKLQWLLEETRPNLSGRFTRDELGMLMNCFQAEILSPQEIRCMASAISDEYGGEPDEIGGSSLLPLVKKLCSLSALEGVTLADALEQAWYRAGVDEKSHLDILADLGIEVA